MSGAPLIAVTGSLQESDGRPPRAVLNAAYLAAIEDSGGISLLLRPEMGSDAIRRALEACRGLVLTGGGDIDPARYGAQRHPATTGISDARDAMEFEALEWALEQRLPLLAICRGMQVLNVAVGGTLWQDLPSERPSQIMHNQTQPRDEATHDVRVKPGSALAIALEADYAATNSMHHQGIRDLGRRLTALAWTDDGLIEGVQIDDYPFGIGVQWHPEELTGVSEPARRLFAAFVRACVAH